MEDLQIGSPVLMDGVTFVELPVGARDVDGRSRRDELKITSPAIFTSS